MKPGFFLRKLKAKATIRSFKNPLVVSLGIIFFINAVILVIAALIALLIDKGHYYYKDFIEAFTTGSIRWMVAPNSVLSFTDSSCSYNWQLTALCGVVVAIEMVLFSGVIIATITTALKSYIDKKMSAKGELPLDHHIVILNWNSKVPEMILNLHKINVKKPIIILSEHKKEEIISEIDSTISLDNLRKERIKINLIVRNGNPLLTSELQDIAIDKADKIFILSPENNDENSSKIISNSDLESLKLVLSLSNFKLREDVNVVVETESYETKKRIDKVVSNLPELSKYDINAVSFNQKLGQILAQVIIEPELAKIYTELLSHDGEAFYTTEDIDVDEYLAYYNNSLPILKLHKMHVLASDEKSIKEKREVPLTGYKKITHRTKETDRKLIIYTVGDNKKKKFLLQNLEIFNKQDYHNFVFKDCGKKFDTNEIEIINESIESKRKEQIKILLLSDDTLSAKAVDANVFVNLIEIKNHILDSKKVSYVTEILDSKNLNSVTKLNIENAIVSNRLISFLLIQMAFNNESKAFFEAMFKAHVKNSHKDFDIVVREVKTMFDTKDLVYETYAELVRSIYYSYDRAIMPIGVIRTNEEHEKQYFYFNKDLDKIMNFSFHEDDQLIFIEY